MSCLSWNCHGFGNLQTEEELVTLVRNKGPMLIFLMETKVKKSILVRIGRKMQYNNCFEAHRHNTGGGLALFWAADSNVDVQSFSDNHIDAIINHGVNDAWWFTGFYGDPKTPTGKTPGPCSED